MAGVVDFCEKGENQGFIHTFIVNKSKQTFEIGVILITMVLGLLKIVLLPLNHTFKKLTFAGNNFNRKGYQMKKIVNTAAILSLVLASMSFAISTKDTTILGQDYAKINSCSDLIGR